MSVVAGAHRERVHGRVEPPRLVVEAEPLEHHEREIALLLDREMSPCRHESSTRSAALGDLRDERNEAALELVEDLANLVGLQTLVEVVQQDVVGALVAHPVEAVDVLVL